MRLFFGGVLLWFMSSGVLLVQSFSTNRKSLSSPRTASLLTKTALLCRMSSETPKTTIRHCSPLLLSSESQALIVLNNPLFKLCPLFESLWERCEYHVCADGGANRLYQADPNYIPHVICGDLDSLKDNVKHYYVSRGAVLKKDVNQDYNDLDKSLCAVQKKGYTRCIVFGAFGGRFDQEMGCLQALYVWKDRMEEIWLYDGSTCAILLAPHVLHEIQVVHHGHDATSLGEGPTCGLVPLGEPCKSLTTTGFQWNLSNQPSTFGGLVSTSNRLIDPKVTVVCSHPIIFTAEVNPGSEDSSK